MEQTYSNIQGIVAIKKATIETQQLAKLKANNTITVFIEKTDHALYFARVSRSNVDEIGETNRTECRIRLIEITQDKVKGYHAGSTAYVVNGDAIYPSIVTSKAIEAHSLMLKATGKHAAHMDNSRVDIDGNPILPRFGYDDMKKNKYKTMISEFITPQDTNEDITPLSLAEIQAEIDADIDTE